MTPAKTQTVLRFSKPGALASALSLTSLPIPRPAPGHALIRVHASAINPSDQKNIEGAFSQTTFSEHGRIPGRDFAGTVVSGPEQYIGKSVWGTGGQNGFEQDGSHAEYVTIDENYLSVMEMPSNLSFPQAAACGVGFLTASMMVGKAAPEQGEHVLILGSSGAVGTACKQLVKLAGAVPVETSRKDGNGSINITEELPSQIESATGGKGIVAVIDTVGETTLFKKSLEALSSEGRYIIITASKSPGNLFTFNALAFYRSNLSMHGINTLPVSFLQAVQQLAKLKKGFEDGVLTPPASIDETELQDEKAVIAAYEKVKAGSKAKQVLVNKNV
ncbi:hypothetical protein MMC18_002901 [Xylographa bjoerkii]|nr:hypothetical protein [Xylographa bjoerkii]